MVKGLVSIITPCYNGEAFIDRYFISILNQTYKNIELFFINDGSTDRTENIALKYKEIFEKQGINFTYIYQENSGQASAINKALKLFNGEFLTWPDSDDILYKDSIEKRVKFLNENKQYALVRNSVKIIDEDTKKQIGMFKLKFNKQNIFKNIITGKKMFYSPISFMVRSIDFIKSNPKREIYAYHYQSQNFQMLLPICYKGKCGTIKEPLCEYYVRKNSHSRIGVKDIDEAIERVDKQEEVFKNVLKDINIDKKYKKVIQSKLLKDKLKIAHLYNDYNLGIKAYKELVKIKKLGLHDIRFILGLKYSRLENIFRKMRDFKNKLKSKVKK